MKKAFTVCILLALLALSGFGSNQKTATVAAGGDLEIPIAELSEQIKIYSFTVDGLNMEVLAAKDSDGTVRTAFNTCQVCNGSRKAYFVEQGDKVVCQNCGNAFGRENVGVLSGGCNPYPIFPEDREDSDTAVRLSYDFLSGEKGLFARWKENGK